MKTFQILGIAILALVLLTSLLPASFGTTPRHKSGTFHTLTVVKSPAGTKIPRLYGSYAVSTVTYSWYHYNAFGCADMIFVMSQQWAWSSGAILGASAPSVQGGAGCQDATIANQYGSGPNIIVPGQLDSSTGTISWTLMTCLPVTGCFNSGSDSFSLVLDFNGNGQGYVGN